MNHGMSSKKDSSDEQFWHYNGKQARRLTEHALDKVRRRGKWMLCIRTCCAFGVLK
jgi:hypothetical protein